MKRVDPPTRAVAVARLREKRASGASISADVRRMAAALLVAESTVWRWLNHHDDTSTAPETASSASSRRYELTEADRDGYRDWRGNVAAWRRARIAAGETDAPSLRRLQRAFATQLSPAERAAAVDGAAGRRRHEVFLRWEPVARNARWETDHKELPIQVTPPRGARACKPWVTVFLDCYSRLIMGWAVSLRPDSATVLAALRRGLVVDPERGPFGGIPASLVPDNGLEFMTTALERVCATLDIALAPTDPYAPHQKGKVERANRTVDQELLSGLPFFTEGPRAADGHLYGPDTPPMTLELFVDRFAAWVIDYNTVRPHAGLNGQTPLQRWTGDPTPIREVPAEQLRWLLLADVERTVNKDGVHFGGVTFIAGALNGLVGEKVQVRYTPHDLRQIEVFRGDAWLCTAYPQGLLTAEQRAAVLARRRADAVELGRRQRRASRRARARLAPITEPGPVTETTTVTAEQARVDDARAVDDTHLVGRGRGGPRGDTRARDAALRRLAMTNLLGLKTDFAYWNPDLPDPTGADVTALDTTPPATPEPDATPDLDLDANPDPGVAPSSDAAPCPLPEGPT